MIKKWRQFLKESVKYKLGCVMIEIPIKNWNKVTDMIDRDDVYVDINDSIKGIETDPHITILYGLKDGTSLEEVIKNLHNYPPLEINIDGVDIFESDRYDVVKFTIEKTKQLEDMFQSLSKIPNENSFPDYSPHITISYVKKGMGKKYVKKMKKNLGKLDTLIFSEPSGKKHEFKLSEKSSDVD